MMHFDNNKGKRINQKQKHILYAAMATNRKILDCNSGDSDVRRTRKAVWKRVAFDLNMAGPEKNITQWRKVWTDLRLGMRKKWDKAQKSEYNLTEYERRVIDACGMIEKSGDEDYNEKCAEDINDFLNFLQEELIEEHEPIQEYSDYFKEGSSNSNSHYLEDSSEFIICQPTEINIKEEFEEEPENFVDYQEPSVEYISDDEPTTRSEEFREPSVECISDDEDPMTTNNIKLESPLNLSYEEPLLTETIACPMPLLSEAVPRPITPQTETIPQQPPIQLECPEMAPSRSLPSSPSPSSSSTNINLLQKTKLKDATLKEIRKMHRNLLRESKKQTALLRKLVQGMQQ